MYCYLVYSNMTDIKTITTVEAINLYSGTANVGKDSTLLIGIIVTIWVW